MSNRARVGQLLMVGLEPASGAPGVKTAVATYGAGGVIFLDGWSGAATVKSVASQVASYASGPALFVAADQEGGQVQQLKGAGFSVIPSAEQQSRLGSAALTTSATGWAEELRAAGVNVNLAPVADTVPADIGTANGPIGRYHREYGATPEVVTQSVTAFIDGMHAGGVAATVKHFPGIGRIAGNTDTASTGITDNVATVTDPDLAPFAAGIAAGADFVMVSSANYPKIAEGQALFAPAIVTGLLRDRLGYAGVVITDDVGAAAAVAAVPIGNRATGFIAAGGDIVLTARPSDIPIMSKVVLAQAAADPVFADQVAAAVTRVLTLKTARGLTTCS
ncbi:MAG TPA: glycoside hydrolase family 3 N-terminal domain-containing protein [Tetrasphaera sp.]|uniref:glycoside hydrolase family 3 N-terminal domain-containing protein n=1 Tax=Nostocoides sp. TaxID=1917966 RepID=UPI002CF33CB4|nr:glycoside hydrolase family 3 N-terminal domain-containing protein [Tetrasphaera sp.]HNQ08152.1 glycoside hydrolase family 3 N-terminal domain-containing protein [Tetrasphaera sp.]